MVDNHASDLYDAVNTWGTSDDFFLNFIVTAPGERAMDLGCGTGGITVAAARAGCSVTGVDPRGMSLKAARSKPDGEKVQWIEGTSSSIPEDTAFDVAIMSANVVQEILDDDDLAETFSDIASHLAPRGRLAFDSRDPDARGWEAWTREKSHRVVALPEGDAEHWYQTTGVDEARGLVDFRAHEVTPDGAEHVTRARLRFRSQEQLCRLLAEAGLEVEKVFGGFQGEPVGRGVGALVVIACRT